MQGIYNYMPETNHISRLCSVTAVPNLQLVLHVMLFYTSNTFCSFTLVFSEVCVQAPMLLFSAVT